ncbi:unnamed protein product [Fusarium graminearum]|nr:unnamed protein product [Fusarium graminearum]
MPVINSIIHPYPQLCTCCASLPWPSRPFQNDSLLEKIPFHKTFKLLNESADQGCALCRLVWSSLVYNCAATSYPKTSWMEMSIDLKIFMTDSEFALISTLKHEGEESLNCVPTRFERVKVTEVELTRSMKSRQVKAFTAESIRQGLMDLIERQVKPWMETCQEQGAYHQNCTKKKNTANLPTRLVDVGQIDDDMVKLVDVKSNGDAEDFTYLILSYCWGNGNANSSTTEKNVARRSQGFTISVLPKTIRDAILLTRMMGFRYLWVDAICIIQGPSGDFHAEAPKMGDYYSESACCIAASSSADSSEGFLIERAVAKYPMTHTGIRIATPPSQDGPPYCIYQEVDNSPYIKKPLLESPLKKRGWCWQELSLPSRILHWTPQGLFLECSSSLFLEDAKIPWQDLEWIEDVTSRVILGMPDTTILLFEGWYRLVTLFSHTQLTYEKDRLYAIHGLASVLIRRTKSEYSNGVFQRSLAQGLLWYHGSRPGKYTRDENSHLPSWCWAYVCPVDFVNIYQAPIYIRDDHPQRPLNYPTTVKDLSTVEGSVSRLYIRAHIIQLTVEKKEGTDIKEKDSDKAFRYFLDRGSKAKHIVASFIRLFSSGGEMDVLWMPVGRVVDSSSDVVGLLIYKLVEENRVTYHRYGMLRYEWIWNEGVCGDLQEIVLV